MPPGKNSLESPFSEIESVSDAILGDEHGRAEPRLESLPCLVDARDRPPPRRAVRSDGAWEFLGARRVRRHCASLDDSVEYAGREDRAAEPLPNAGEEIAPLRLLRVGRLVHGLAGLHARECLRVEVADRLRQSVRRFVPAGAHHVFEALRERLDARGRHDDRADGEGARHRVDVRDARSPLQLLGGERRSSDRVYGAARQPRQDLVDGRFVAGNPADGG